MLEQKRSENMEISYANDYPEVFCCPICYEPMDSPQRKPMTTFPCGHSICQECLNRYESENSENRRCCVCNTPYTKATINYSFQKIIQSGDFKKKKPHLKSETYDNICRRVELYQNMFIKACAESKKTEEELNVAEEVFCRIENEMLFDKEQIIQLTSRLESMKKELVLLNDDEKSLKSQIAGVIKDIRKLELLVKAKKLDE